MNMSHQGKCVFNLSGISCGNDGVWFYFRFSSSALGLNENIRWNWQPVSKTKLGFVGVLFDGGGGGLWSKMTDSHLCDVLQQNLHLTWQQYFSLMYNMVASLQLLTSQWNLQNLYLHNTVKHSGESLTHILRYSLKLKGNVSAWRFSGRPNFYYYLLLQRVCGPCFHLIVLLPPRGKSNTRDLGKIDIYHNL